MSEKDALSATLESIPSILYVKMTPNLHTQHTYISDSFGVVKFCSLRGEGRRGWERRVKNGVRMKHMINYNRLDLL